MEEIYVLGWSCDDLVVFVYFVCVVEVSSDWENAIDVFEAWFSLETCAEFFDIEFFSPYAACRVFPSCSSFVYPEVPYVYVLDSYVIVD